MLNQTKLQILERAFETTTPNDLVNPFTTAKVHRIHLTSKSQFNWAVRKAVEWIKELKASKHTDDEIFEKLKDYFKTNSLDFDLRVKAPELSEVCVALYSECVVIENAVKHELEKLKQPKPVPKVKK